MIKIGDKVEEGIAMSRWKNVLGGIAMTTGVATVVAVTGFAPLRLSEAGFLPTQEPAKPGVQVQIREVLIDQPVQGMLKQAVRAEFRIEGQINQVPAANGDEMTKEMIRQLTPILRNELRLLTSSAEPTPTQRRAIAMEGGRVLKMVAGNLARAGNGFNQVRRLGTGTSDPKKLIQDAIELEAITKLLPEQFTRYRKELDSKFRIHQEVVLLNLVAKIDRVLFLSVDQRDKLCESLRSHWDHQNQASVEVLEAHDSYFPVIPEPQIHPLLTEEQWKVWRELPKVQFESIRINNLFGRGGAITREPEEEDADLKAALAEDPKP